MEAIWWINALQAGWWDGACTRKILQINVPSGTRGAPASHYHSWARTNSFGGPMLNLPPNLTYCYPGVDADEHQERVTAVGTIPNIRRTHYRSSQAFRVARHNSGTRVSSMGVSAVGGVVGAPHSSPCPPQLGVP